MNLPFLCCALPILMALFAGLWGTPKQGAIINLCVSVIVLGLTIIVFAAPGAGLVHADSLGMIFGVLTGFVCLSTAFGNLGFVDAGMNMMSMRRWRVYHAMCLVLEGSVLLGLYADNIGVLWVAVEGATIAGTLAVSLPRTALAMEAAWKYFVLGSVGIALALFGTMLIYLAAQPALGPGLQAMSFAALSAHAPALDGNLLTLACIFLLFGYGTKAALVPLHGWLPEAYAEGPIPITTALSGLTLNVALIAILRFRHLMQANAEAGGAALHPGPALLALGLASIFLVAFSLNRRRDIRRFFGFSSIEHSGIAIFAFGVGGAAAMFGGLLHMLLHTLIKSALFQTLAQSAALRGSVIAGDFTFAKLRGMSATNPYLGWLFGGCIFALTGLPPSGLFASEFIIISQTVQRIPLVSLPLGLGLMLCAIALIRKVGPLVFAAAPTKTIALPSPKLAHLVSLHLMLVFAIAFFMPMILLNLFSGIAVSLQ